MQEKNENELIADSQELVAEVDGKMVTADELLANLSISKNKPSQEEIDQAEKEYNEAAQTFAITEYEIGTIKEANDIYKFFNDYLKNHVFWTKNGWMGVIKLNDEVEAKYKEFKTNKTPFTLGYQALEFTMFMLSNPGGIGLKSAKAIELMSELYIFVMEEVSAQLEGARLKLKDIQFMYDKWVSMQQGFYLEKEDGVEQIEPTEPPLEETINT